MHLLSKCGCTSCKIPEMFGIVGAILKKAFVSSLLWRKCFFLFKTVLIQNKSMKTETQVTSSHFITPNYGSERILNVFSSPYKQLLNSGSFSLLLQIKKSFFDMVIIHY